MIRCEVTRSFTLGKYKELINVVKVITRKENEFDKGDTFECDEEMAKYLTGNNANGDVVVRIIEVVPEEKEKKGGETKMAEVKEEKKEVDTKKVAKNIINATKAVKLGKQIKSKIEKR